MSKLLSIETSSDACSVALHCDGTTVEFHRHAPMRHAELLLPAVRSLLDKADLSLERLDAIACGRGPGSFTSLRIGIGVVQGLAWGAGLPVVPVSSLASIAQDAADLAGRSGATVCVAVDARMQEVYTANFSCGKNGIVVPEGNERVCDPALVQPADTGQFIAAGNGFERFEALALLAAAAAESHPEIQPRAETISRLALDWLGSHEPLPAAMAQPVYVRNQVASKPETD